MSILQVEDVHCYYGDSHVLQGMTLSVPPNSVVGLLGRNGVGKSTMINTIMGLVKARRGRISLGGQNITAKPAYTIAGQGVALVPQGRRIFSSLDVSEHLQLGLRRGGTWTLERVFELFPRLAERRHQRAQTLSGGEQSMLSLARALLLNPTLLLMDEPTEGLAPVMVDAIADAIRILRTERHSILLVEQDVSLALDLVDYAYIITKGAVVWQGSADSLRTQPSIQLSHLGLGKVISGTLADPGRRTQNWER